MHIFFCRVAFILAMTVSSSVNTSEDSESEETKECGQYGFRCLDEKTLEFCPIVVDGVTDVAQLYECDETFTCDENNPSYCTPKETPNKIVQEANREGHHGVAEVEGDVDLGINSYNDLYFNSNSFYRQIRAAATAATTKKEDDCVCETTTPAEESTTTTESDEESEFTTINITPPSPFDCDSYGFFPDPDNKTLFWHCDVPQNGNGYLLRHMKCGHDRYFDVMLKCCVLEGTIRQERSHDPDVRIEVGKRKIKYATDCKIRKPGKYADEFDCHVYHLCLSKQFSPAIQMTFFCPRQTAYDALTQTCSIAAFKRCEAKSQKSNNINCTSPMRFRSIDDCRSYFVCFLDNVIEIKCPKFYKFDDLAMECLPEKIAECKEVFG